jgi:predicted dehydrogenase
MLNRREFLATGAAMGAGFALSGATPFRTGSDAARTIGIGVIGVGGRGSGLLQILLGMGGVAIRAVCDIVPARAAGAQARVLAAGQAEPTAYTRDAMHWTELCERDDLDAVIIATPWEWHARMAVGALRKGKVAGVEVPCAITLQECWDLVNAHEETGVPAMMLENWSFRADNLAVLNLIRQGVFGHMVHCHCAHSHDCLGHWYFGAAKAWAGKYLTSHNCDLYPTHDLGPVLSWMDINCGDAFDYLTATATDPFGPKDYFTRTLGADHHLARQTYTQGDIVTSVVRTKKGRTIVINNDMQLPRPYDNRWLIQGTRGLYSEERNAVSVDGGAWEPFAPWQEAYTHAWWQQDVSADGHGGTDWLELKLFVDAVRNRTQTPLDIYDSVVMSCVFPLSGESIAKGSAPVQVPDFTRGKWETRAPYFALDPRAFRRPGAPLVEQTADGHLAQTLPLGLGPLKTELPGVTVRTLGEPTAFAGWPPLAGQPSHCLFSAQDWGLEVTLPKGVAGTVAVYAYDPEGLRRQSVVFQNRPANDLDDFRQGVWLEYPFTAADSAEGVLRLHVRLRSGANSVLSKLRVTIPAPA